MAEIVPGRAAEHPLGLDADGVDLARARVDRHHRRLGEHDAAAAHVDERVGGAEVDRHVAAAEAGEVGEEAHAESGAAQRGRTRRAARRESIAGSGEAANALQAAPEEVEQRAQRQPDDVEVVALDRRARARRRAPWIA